MIILADGAKGQSGPVVTAEPQVCRFDHRGVRFALDPNTLKLAALEEGESEDVLQDFASPLKPNFHLGNPTAPGCICFDVTRACNLRCSYCFAQHDDERNQKDLHLSFSDAVDGLSLLFPRALREGNLRNHKVEYSFFGGEPLTRWDFIEQMVKHITAWIPCRRHFHVTTNGTLMTPEIAKFLEVHQFSTIVSIDGTETAHNECRVKADGSGTYSDVMRCLEILKKHAPTVLKSTTLRSTFTPKSIKTESLWKRIEHLNELVEQGYGNYVSVEPAFLGEHTCMDRTVVEREAIDYTVLKEEWQKQYDDAADGWLARLKEDKPVFFHHFISFARRMVSALPGCTECGAAKGYFTIAPGGELFACHHEGGTRIGNIHTGGVEEQLRAIWQDNRYYTRIKCPDCPIRNICGGGCREYSVSQGLGVSMPVPNECEQKWMFVRTIAWLMYQILPDKDLRKKVERYWMPNKQGCAPKGK